MDKLIIAAFTFLFALKLTHVVDWSWWVITAPLWSLLLSSYEVVKIKKDE